jgi:hypothetical protein
MGQNSEQDSDGNIPQNLDNNGDLEAIDYEPEDVDAHGLGHEGSSNPPMAIYQPWDTAFEQTDFHIQNPEDGGEIDVYSGHAGTAHIWSERVEGSDEVRLVYEFDSTLSFEGYPTLEAGPEMEQDLEIAARKALSTGDSGITVRTSKDDIDAVVQELGALDERLLEEGHAEYEANLLSAIGEGIQEAQLLEDEVSGGEFERHEELYQRKDKIEA